MSEEPTNRQQTSVDDLMQRMSLQAGLPLAPDLPPAPPTVSPPSLRDVRVKEVMERFDLTREQAIQELAAFGF